ncbi:MAG: family transcriptional regulator, cyclic receptor protein [Solirubrobacteraceae bacterium]|nr:family transcriptional regulator, cyclic receptor protein [Solirubrobacteraceae bacterium]
MSGGALKPPEPRLRRCYVLDEDPDLGGGLEPAVRAAARRLATAPVTRLPAGPQPLQAWYGFAVHGPGLLLISGVIARELRVADRCATELLGPGDLLRPWDLDLNELVPCEVLWRVLVDAEVALLDDGFAERIRQWPSIAEELLARAEHRAESLAIERAIASHPKVDMRVAMELWHLAGRWGRIRPDGSVQIELPLTHRLISELVGAERPTVSHALTRLTKAGLIEHNGPHWALFGSPGDHAAVAQRPLKPRL